MSPLDPNELTRLLAESPLFSGLDTDAAQLLVETAERDRYAAGEYVFRQGDDGDLAFLIVAGRFAAIDDRAEGTVRRQMHPGDLFGEYALFLGGTRTLSVKCEDDGIVLAFPRDRFHAFLEKTPTAAIRILETTVKRLDEAEKALASLDPVEASTLRFKDL